MWNSAPSTEKCDQRAVCGGSESYPLAAAPKFWQRLPQQWFSFRFEAHLELGVELMKAVFHPTGDVGPAPILERGDGDSQFEFDGILGLKVTTAVAAE